MDDAELHKAAVKRLKAKRDFWNLVGVWVVVSIVTNLIWWLSSGFNSYYWPVWPIAGMGIAVLFSALDAYGPGRRGVTENAIEREKQRIRDGM